MPILETELALESEAEYELLQDAELFPAWQVLAHKYNLSFELKSTSENVSNGQTAFDVVQVDDVFFRIVNDVLEKYDPLTEVWTLISAFVPLDGGISTGYSLVAQDDFLYIYGGTAATVQVTSTEDFGETFTDWETIASEFDNVSFVAGVTSERVHYIAADTTNNIYNLRCVEYDGVDWNVIQSGIWWPYAITTFDAVEFNDEDIIVAATQVPGNTTARYINNKVVKYIYSAGGVVAFKYRFQSWSDHLELDIVDDVRSFRLRENTRISVINEQLYVTAYTVTGTSSFPQAFYRYYTSKDGIWWSEGYAIPLPEADANAGGVMLWQLGEYGYAFESGKLYRCDSTLQLGYSAAVCQEDITDRLNEYSLSFQESTQASFLLDNSDDFLSNNSVLTRDNTVMFEHKVGYRDPNSDYAAIMITVALTELDSINQDGSLPENTLRLTARDRIAWMSDRSASEQAHYWESQLVGGDNYTDDTNTNYGGLRHTATQSGMWQTASNELTIQANNQEAVAFGTFSIYVWNGSQQTRFHLATSGNKEFAGVCFRAADKDNMWFARYEQQADRIRLYQRSVGVDTQQAQTSTLSWSATPLTARWLKVEFYYAHIVVYSSTDGITWTNQIDFYSEGVSGGGFAPDLTPISVQSLEKGSVGTIGRGFAPASASSAWSLDPGFIDLPSFIGTPPLPAEGESVPTKIFALGVQGGARRSFGVVGGDAQWEDISSGLTGQGRWACADPFAFGRRFVITSDGLFNMGNVWLSSPSWTLVASNTAMFGSESYNGNYVMMSHNRQGWIMVISGSSGVSVSFDYGITWTRTGIQGLGFATEAGNTLDGYSGHAEINGHNSVSSGIIYFSYMSQPDANFRLNIAKSTDWGLTWSNPYVQSGATTVVANPLIAIPYKTAGGVANNVDGANLVGYLVWGGDDVADGYILATHDGINTAGNFWGDEGSALTAASGKAISSPRRRSITTFTGDGDVFYFVRQVRGGAHPGTIWFVEDGDTASAVQVPNFSQDGFHLINLNGFPLNREALLVWSSGSNNTLGDGSFAGGFIKFTTDQGDTWTDITTGIGFDGSFTAYADFDLTEFVN